MGFQCHCVSYSLCILILYVVVACSWHQQCSSSTVTAVLRGHVFTHPCDKRLTTCTVTLQQSLNSTRRRVSRSEFRLSEDKLSGCGKGAPPLLSCNSGGGVLRCVRSRLPELRWETNADFLAILSSLLRLSKPSYYCYMISQGF